jgi:hypothetical protein
MTYEQSASETRISNWTLATGTEPGQRSVVGLPAHPAAPELRKTVVLHPSRPFEALRDKAA